MSSDATTPAIDGDSRSISSMTTVLVSNKAPPASMADQVPHEPHERDLSTWMPSGDPSTTTISQGVMDGFTMVADASRQESLSSLSVAHASPEIELDQDLREEWEQHAARIREAFRGVVEKQRKRNKKKADGSSSQIDHPDHQKREDDDDDDKQHDSKIAAQPSVNKGT